MIAGLVVATIGSTVMMLLVWLKSAEEHRRGVYLMCWLTIGLLIAWSAIRWGHRI